MTDTTSSAKRKTPLYDGELERRKRQFTVTFSDKKIPDQLRDLAWQWELTTNNRQRPNPSAVLDWLLRPCLEAALRGEFSPPSPGWDLGDPIPQGIAGSADLDSLAQVELQHPARMADDVNEKAGSENRVVNETRIPTWIPEWVERTLTHLLSAVYRWRPRGLPAVSTRWARIIRTETDTTRIRLDAFATAWWNTVLEFALTNVDDARQLWHAPAIQQFGSIVREIEADVEPPRDWANAFRGGDVAALWHGAAISRIDLTWQLRDSLRHIGVARLHADDLASGADCIGLSGLSTAFAEYRCKLDAAHNWLDAMRRFSLAREGDTWRCISLSRRWVAKE